MHNKPPITHFKALLALVATLVAGMSYSAPYTYLQASESGYTLYTLDEYLYLNNNHIDLDVEPEFKCFVQAVWQEARGESIKGQQAIAQVLYNRADSGVFPDDVCAVVKQKEKKRCQFTWNCDSKKKDLYPSQEEMEDMSQYLASIYIGEYTLPEVGNNVVFFKSCKKPSRKWFTNTEFKVKIGSHCFYQAKVK